jgi:uncharacterized membrane protein YgcG
MAYTDSLLASGEHVIRHEHQHWFVLAWNARSGVLSIVAGFVLLVVLAAAGQANGSLDFLRYVAVVLLLVGVVILAWGWLRYRNEEYVITNRRIIHSEGVINKTASDSSLEKINDAILKESIFGRMFGFGDLEVLTASESGIELLRMLRDAKGFKIAMVDAKHQLEMDLGRPEAMSGGPGGSGGGQPAGGDTGTHGAGGSWAPAPAAPAAQASSAQVQAPMSSDEVARALDRLGDLRDRGIVTPEEFEAKKRELLARL